MSSKEFLSKCNACSGNWCAMIMSGIKNCFPTQYDNMEDKEYNIFELMTITAECGVNWED